MLALSRTRVARRCSPTSRLAISPISQQIRSYATRTRAAEILGTAGNALLIGSVVTLFGYITYTLYDNLFAEHGTTRIYNQSLDLVRANPQIKELFGTSIMGFGEPSHGQRQRQRAISHRQYEDAEGRNCLVMQYYIEDATKMRGERGVVKLEMTEAGGAWDYSFIVVDVYRNGQVAGRIDVLVTEEFKTRVRAEEKEKRSRRFSPKVSGGSWVSVLNPATWRR
ncbi:mitochondrial import inner membrane translocase subunit tim21 [Coemansia sp. RSA 2050]|nr:mitochondrial import inner membrane translocase subunit tim21 [Coemansia sp. RSA 2050]KAJ2733144.1 mitochondrial import inner membrane translocase subunit tim21 [Coemansia sp. BCRC 34962]